MSTHDALWQATPPPCCYVTDSATHWYAIRSRSRHEKEVARQLARQNIEAFLPVICEFRKWSDRRKRVELPLFPGYAFVRVNYQSADRLRVLRTVGVAGFVGANIGEGGRIPDHQIAHIRTLMESGVPMKAETCLKVGQRVRIRGGSLDGVEGVLVGHRGDNSLLISVTPIQRSIAISLSGYDVEAVH